MSKNQSEASQNTDPAGRLIELIKKIKKISTTRKNNSPMLGEVPMWKAVRAFSSELGFTNDLEMRENLILTRDHVIRNINALEMKRESTRTQWTKAILTVCSVFDSDHFGKRTDAVISACFTQINIERTEAISERFLMVGIKETTSDELTDAIKVARKALEAYEKRGKISKDLVKLLKHYLQQLEAAYQHYDDFGEEVFWEAYKKLFATFVQIHPVVIPGDRQEEFKQAINDMGAKLPFGLRTLAVSADIATLATVSVTAITLLGS